jgi:hypothetical protein
MRCSSGARSRTLRSFGHSNGEGVQGVQVGEVIEELRCHTLDYVDTLDSLVYPQKSGPRLTLRRGQSSSRRPLAVSSTGPMGVASPNEAPQPAM